MASLQRIAYRGRDQTKMTAMGKTFTGQMRLWRLSIALLTPATALLADAAVADPVQTGAQLYLDVKGSNLGDKIGSAVAQDPTAASTSTASSDPSKKIDLGLVPLTLSAKDSDSGFGVTAGGNGQYVVPLSDSFSLISHGGFAKSQGVGGSLFGDTTVDAGPGLAFRQDDFAWLLQPDIGVTMQSAALQQIDYGVGTTLSKDLLSGLTATTTTGYKLQDAADGPSRLANGSAGLSYTLPNKIKLGLGYQVEQKLSTSDQLLADKQGPSLSAEIPVTDSLNLGTSYSYNTSAADAAAVDLGTKGRDVEQTLGISAAWDIGADINADVKLKANLDLTRQSQSSTDTQQVQKSGTVGMQMKF